MKSLPKKPSRLIRLALKDLAEREADPRYAINMTLWHAPVAGICRVCLAGCMLARCGVSPSADTAPSEFREPLRGRLFALNSFRTGDIQAALYSLRIKRPAYFPTRVDIPGYDSDKEGFKVALLKLADRFERRGL